MAIRARPVFLLDLDGTLVDPWEGMAASCRHALASFGVFPSHDDELRRMVGPPIRQAFGELLGGRGDVEEAIRLYRARYGELGLYQATVYAGIRETLAALFERGTRLMLCTSKSRVFAQRVVDHFGLSSVLSGVYGAELDGRFDDKGELIGHILAAEGLRPDDVCMVGDRKHDVLGAARHGAPTIGVLWGFGGRQELEAAGAALVVETPHQLLPSTR